MTYHIPPEILDSHIGILGKTGSGKTITAKGCAEQLLKNGQRVCAIDPTGVWWGLKSSANGKKGAYPVTIFGGEHADFPIGPNHGEAIAEIIGTTETSSIIDTRLMTVGERTRFFTAFAETLLRKNRGPLHLIIDEAHVFAPQGRVADPASGQMLHAANNLVSLGRGIGLRIIMITQRPAKLHKDSLTQIETLVAMRLIAPQDRRAVEDWMGEWTDKSEGADVLKSLPTMPTGEGWIWAPEKGVLKKVKFPMISTYDSSAAPAGDRDSVVLAPIDNEGIASRLETIASNAFANDPARLRKRITELEKELAKKLPAAPDSNALADAWSDGHSSGYVEGKTEGVQGAIKALDDFAKTMGKLVHPKKPPPSVIKPQVTPPIRQVEAKTHKVATGTLPDGERKVLTAIAQHADGCTREQLTILTAYKKSSRDAYIQRLSSKSYVVKHGDRILSTPDGRAALGDDFEPLPTGQELLTHWLNNLPEGERLILSFVAEAYPSGLHRDQISAMTAYKKSSRDAYIQRLRARQLVTVSAGLIVASENFF